MGLGTKIVKNAVKDVLKVEPRLDGLRPRTSLPGSAAPRRPAAVSFSTRRIGTEPPACLTLWLARPAGVATMRRGSISAPGVRKTTRATEAVSQELCLPHYETLLTASRSS